MEILSIGDLRQCIGKKMFFVSPCGIEENVPHYIEIHKDEIYFMGEYEILLGTSEDTFRCLAEAQRHWVLTYGVNKVSLKSLYIDKYDAMLGYVDFAGQRIVLEEVPPNYLSEEGDEWLLREIVQKISKSLVA